ncbi:unnamed protein product [Bursaphelenchus xylophilus]|uniref:(pine wood nematode) hypothetical protein n=1 Tax=Bursaphelenchus xylophilus TaxID=6326 RepID=A0A1I7RQI5_BURXY|nr:unnamed protein product [Bursaphelenchus xylophilus]CAG9104634.1 unnamed protein product [Bursaphelenchus xylophilus]
MGSKTSQIQRKHADDVYDTYITRWDFFPTHSAFFQGPAGTVVTAFRFHPKVHYTSHQTKETRVLEDLVYVFGNNKRKGLIPVIFLQLFNKIGRPFGALGAVIDQCSPRKEIIEARWFLPRVSFAEVSIYFAENVIEAGSWLVCNPQETEPISNRWAEYWLAIKTYDGHPQRTIEIFENSRKWNRKIAEKCSLEPRKLKFLKETAKDKDETDGNHKEEKEYGLEELWKQSAMESGNEKQEFLVDLIDNYLKREKDGRSVARNASRTAPLVSRDAQKDGDLDGVEGKTLPLGRLVKLANKTLSTPGKAPNPSTNARKSAGTDEKKMEGSSDKVQAGKDVNKSAQNPAATPLNSITTNENPAGPKSIEPNVIKNTVNSIKKLITDSLPATLDPPPPVIFLRIKRTETGRFYLFKPHEETFPSIYHLLNAYTGHSLPLDTNFPVILGEPVRYHEREQIGIPPIGLPVPAPVRPTMRCIGLVNSPAPLWKEKKADLGSNGPLNVVPYQSNASVYTFVYTAKQARKIGVTSPLGESFFGKVQAGRKSFKSVFKYLKDDYINHEQFLKDLMKLYSSTRTRQGFVKPGDHIYIPTGLNFLAKVTGFDIVSAKKWIAFSHAGLYSVPEVMKLWGDEGKLLYWRGKIEIVHQVAAAMMHLEQNGLCHRALKASNVIVKEAGEFSWRVVVTDFLLPYSFLVTVSKKPSDYITLHWRWMAPESLEKSQFDIISDVWAFGCTSFQILTWGKEPWSYDNDVKTPVDVLEKIKNGKMMKFGSEKQRKIPYYLKKLIEICMNKAEKERPSFQKLHNYLSILLYDATKPMGRTIYENLIGGNKEFQKTANIPASQNAGK